MDTYIYALHCPIAETVRYVGKTTNPSKRLNGHISAARRMQYRHHTSAWIRKVLRTGGAPTMEILEVVPEGADWQAREIFWIAHGISNNWPLTNSTKGGDGVDLSTPELRDKWLSAIKESQRRPEVLAAKARDMKRRHQDPAYREKIREAFARPEVLLRRNAAISAAHQARAARIRASKPVISREEKEAIKLANYRNVWTPEKKEAQSKVLAARADYMKKSLTLEVIARRAETLRATHAKRKAERDAVAAMQAAALREQQEKGVQEWLQKDCEFGASFLQLRHELFASYTAAQMGTMKQTQFYSYLEQLGFVMKKSSSRFYLGLKLAAATSTPYTESS